MVNRILSLWLIALLCLPLYAQKEQDSIILHFRMNESHIDSSFTDNQIQLDKLHELLSLQSLTYRLDSLSITGSSSPDGKISFNQELAKSRTNALVNHIHSTYPGTKGVPVSIHSVSYLWKDLIPQLSQDTLLQNKNEILKILHNEHTLPFQKQLLLKRLQNGTIYQHIASRHFNNYRYVHCNLYLSPIEAGNTGLEYADNQQFTPPRKAKGHNNRSQSIRFHSHKRESLEA